MYSYFWQHRTLSSLKTSFLQLRAYVSHMQNLTEQIFETLLCNLSSQLIHCCARELALVNLFLFCRQTDTSGAFLTSVYHICSASWWFWLWVCYSNGWVVRHTLFFSERSWGSVPICLFYLSVLPPLSCLGFVFLSHAYSIVIKM